MTHLAISVKQPGHHLTRMTLLLGALALVMLSLGIGALSASAAGIILSKKVGPPGTIVGVTGSGFAGSEIVRISFDTAAIASTFATASGTLSVTVTIPTTALPGNHTIFAKGATSGLVALAFFTVRTTWVMFHDTASREGDDTTENLLNPTTVAFLPLKWASLTGNKVISSPAVDNGMVYVGSNDNKLRAFNIATRKLVWFGDTGGPVVSSPAVGGQLVYVGSSDGFLYAFNANTGLLMWRTFTGGAVTSSPAIGTGVVYVGSASGRVFALDALSGRIVWTSVLGFSITSSPTLTRSALYVNSGGSLYALNITDGLQLWHMTGNFTGTVTVYRSSLFASTATGELIAINLTKHVTLWFKLTSGPIASSPAVDGAHGIVYVGSNDKRLYAFSATTGAILWSTATGAAVTSSPSVANGVVYVGSLDKRVYALDAATGKILWSFLTGGAVESSPAIADGQVYVGSDDMKLYAFGH